MDLAAHWPIVFLAAVLLSVERISYAFVWHRPATFRSLLSHLPFSLMGARDPVGALAKLFFSFKVLQFAVFFGWFLWFGNGRIALPTASIGVLALAAVLIVSGQILNFSVFARLGRNGVFYGERFGHELPWIETFPFSVVKHPQYVGTVISIWGFFLAMRFPNPDWIIVPLIETLYYIVGANFEQPLDGDEEVSPDESTDEAAQTSLQARAERPM